MSSALIRRLGIGRSRLRSRDFKNMSIFATIDKLFEFSTCILGVFRGQLLMVDCGSICVFVTDLSDTWRKTVDRASKVFLEMHYNQHKRLTNDIA
ncbi:hypothetical protein CsSME_00031431 [Camellia sinensis var. sinensis]